MKGLFKISFNADYVKKISKTKFVREFSKVYPDHDLEAIYNDIVGTKKSKF